MSIHLLEVQVNGKTKYVSHVGKDVYWDDSKGRGYFRLKGTSFYNDEIRDLSTNKVLSNFEIAQLIRNKS